jgi:hypothetical protein
LAEKLNFTKPALEALLLPAPGKRAAYVDIKVPVLQLRVTASGVKTFVVYRRIKGGNPSRVTLGRFPALTIERARNDAAKVNLEIEGGSNPTAIKRANREEMTFGDLFDDYLALHSKPNKRTWKEDKAKYSTYLAAPLGGKKVSAIGRSDVAVIHGAITRAGHGVTANRVLALVSSVRLGQVGRAPQG